MRGFCMIQIFQPNFASSDAGCDIYIFLELFSRFCSHDYCLQLLYSAIDSLKERMESDPANADLIQQQYAIC